MASVLKGQSRLCTSQPSRPCPQTPQVAFTFRPTEKRPNGHSLKPGPRPLWPSAATRTFSFQSLWETNSSERRLSFEVRPDHAAWCAPWAWGHPLCPPPRLHCSSPKDITELALETVARCLRLSSPVGTLTVILCSHQPVSPKPRATPLLTLRVIFFPDLSSLLSDMSTVLLLPSVKVFISFCSVWPFCIS